MSDWKYDLDEVGDDASPTADERDEPLEPGSPSIENAAFVLLGVLSMLFVFVRILVL
jgi:hypothetical protein